MMLRKFFQFVEIKTKITSVLPFFLTLAWLFYQKQAPDWKLTAIFFFSMLLIDLATTAINNYIDSRKYPEMLPFSRRTALAVLLTLLNAGAGLGLYLAYATDPVVLLVGSLCLLCGVCYTFGPIPISRLPLGEIFSGIFQGVLIPFLLLYINMPAGTYLTFALNTARLDLSLQLKPLITLLLFTVPPALATANIMLANNICDLQKDTAVGRFTLPYYIGKKTSIRLFAALCYLAYFVPCLMVLLRLLPVTCLLLLITLPPVHKNISIFQAEQKKETTFIVSIQNYILLIGTYALCLLPGGLMEQMYHSAGKW